MNKFSKYLVIFCAVLFASAISAQQTQSQNANTEAENRVAVANAQKEAATQEADVQRRLAEARQRLEQAAKEVAVLSGQVGGGPAFLIRDGFHDHPRAMLGVNISGVQGDGNSDGVKVLGVGPDSPADKAGLKAGDILTSIDGKSLTGASSAESSEILLKHMAGIEPGKSVMVEYKRDGKKHKAEIKTAVISLALRQRFGPAGPVSGHLTPVPVAPMFNNPFAQQWGDLELAGLTPRLGKYFGTEEGILVVRAPRDDNMKLEDGDVILSIDGRKPNDPGHAMRILRSYATGEKLTMEVMRDKRRHKVEMTVPESRNDNFMFRTVPGAMTAPAAPPRPQAFHLQRQMTPPPGPKQTQPPGPPHEGAPI